MAPVPGGRLLLIPVLNAPFWGKTRFVTGALGGSSVADRSFHQGKGLPSLAPRLVRLQTGTHRMKAPSTLKLSCSG